MPDPFGLALAASISKPPFFFQPPAATRSLFVMALREPEFIDRNTPTGPMRTNIYHTAAFLAGHSQSGQANRQFHTKFHRL